MANKKVKYTDEARNLAQKVKNSADIHSAWQAKLYDTQKTDFQTFIDFRETHNKIMDLLKNIEIMASLDANDVIETMADYDKLDQEEALRMKSLGNRISTKGF